MATDVGGRTARYDRMGFRRETADVGRLWRRFAACREFDVGARCGGSPAMALRRLRSVPPAPDGWAPHLETVRFWVARFAPFVGGEGAIPYEWAVSIDRTGDLVDGHHRLTAAYAVGLKSLPAWRP